MKNETKEVTQRGLSEFLGVSLGKINSAIKSLYQDGFLSGYSITAKGVDLLLPYKVDNAVIMAAGLSSRFAPLSYEKPKGLYEVKGEVLIERQIRQLKEVGINDIYIVVGYMKEKFFYLEDKFGVKIIVNEDYYKYNNSSTLYLVKDFLKNTFICSSDNYFSENVFENYIYDSYYSAVYSEGKTSEYCLTFGKNELIKSVSIGGEDQWYMLGHVYFSRTFSDKFVPLLEDVYSVSGDTEDKTKLWEDLYMRNIKTLRMYIRKYSNDTIFEFDSLDELREFDANYIDNADSEIMRNIAKVLNCETKEIRDIKPIKAGLTNVSFKFDCKGKSYVYRHPGKGTERYISRKSEAYSMQIAKELGLDGTFIYMDANAGWKISSYLDNCREMDYHNDNDIDQALSLIRTLHKAKIHSNWDFDIWSKTNDFVKRVSEVSNRMDFKDFDELYSLMEKVYKKTEEDKFPKILCHCDSYSPNFITNDKQMNLIDWEYSGNDDPGSDLGTFICCSDYTYEEALNVLNLYFERELTYEELRHFIGYIAIASYYWFVWAIYQESIGSKVGEYLYLWYKNSKDYGRKALSMYEN